MDGRDCIQYITSAILPTDTELDYKGCAFALVIVCTLHSALCTHALSEQGQNKEI